MINVPISPRIIALSSRPVFEFLCLAHLQSTVVIEVDVKSLPQITVLDFMHTSQTKQINVNSKAHKPSHVHKS